MFLQLKRDIPNSVEEVMAFLSSYLNSINKELKMKSWFRFKGYKCKLNYQKNIIKIYAINFLWDYTTLHVFKNGEASRITIETFPNIIFTSMYVLFITIIALGVSLKYQNFIDFVLFLYLIFIATVTITIIERYRRFKILTVLIDKLPLQVSLANEGEIKKL